MTMFTWYQEIKMHMQEEGFHFAKPRENCRIDIPELEEYTESATYREEDVPVLLQYYNPIVAPHIFSEAGTGDSFKCLFDDGGDFDFREAPAPVPGITLDDTIALIKAGILNETRTETDQI